MSQLELLEIQPPFKKGQKVKVTNPQHSRCGSVGTVIIPGNLVTAVAFSIGARERIAFLNESLAAVNEGGIS